jgi:hypothetical protein
MNVIAGSSALPNGVPPSRTVRAGSHKLEIAERPAKGVIRLTVDIERSQPVLDCQSLNFCRGECNIG